MTDSMSHEDNLAAAGEAFLEHYGKKGMKWGVRNEDTAAGTKPTSDDIRVARGNVATQKRAIATQTAKTNASAGKEREVEGQKLSEMSADYLRNPDRATAARMTTGEKAAVVALAVFVPTIGTAAAVGVAGTRVVKRRSIEREVGIR